MNFVAIFIGLLAQILTMAILIRAVLSWFPMSTGNALVALVYQITEPVLAPIRRIVPRIGLLDFSPLVAIILLQIIQRIVLRL